MNYKSIGKLIGRVAFWVFTILLFGFFQVLVAYWLSLFSDQVVFSFSEFIEQGVFLVFGVGLIGAMTLDFYMENELNIGRIGSAYLLFLYPLIIFTISLLIYVLMFLRDSYNYEAIKSAQLYIFLIIIIHSAATKGTLYYQKTIKS